MTLINLSAAALADKLSSGEVSSVEATQAHLDRIEAVDGDVHAFLHVSADALATAAAVDAKRASGEKLGPLAGVPVAIKDVLCRRPPAARFSRAGFPRTTPRWSPAFVPPT
jgi:aspartyl-tRNA(Asn)/glutamyl-tRNA(Gln) amidotransferase subunit A